jgi:hypothetical protein
VLPSAIRTLSVLTLLSAVTGSVVLTHQAKPTVGSGTQNAAFMGPNTIARDPGDRASRSAARAALAENSRVATTELVSLRAERVQDVALGVKYRELREKRWKAEKEEARKKAEARAEARRKAEAKEARERKERAERAARASRSSGGSGTGGGKVTGGDPKSIARSMLAERGWSGQFGCLDSLFKRESGWRVHAQNPSSGAYGIPQALPGRKMASAGPDWRNNAATQIRWALGYIEDRYGTPCGAWSHSQRTGWY